MLAFEVAPPGSDWTLLFDSVYVRFDDEEDPLRAVVGAQMIETAGAYGQESWHGVELLAGLRYWRFWADVDLLGLAGTRQEEVWVDPVVGVRARAPLGERWSLLGRADVGGFGVEADWIYQARADVRYAFAGSWGAELGYRFLSIDHADAGIDVTLAGPSVGVRWSF